MGCIQNGIQNGHVTEAWCSEKLSLEVTFRRRTNPEKVISDIWGKIVPWSENGEEKAEIKLARISMLSEKTTIKQVGEQSANIILHLCNRFTNEFMRWENGSVDKLLEINA